VGSILVLPLLSFFLFFLSFPLNPLRVEPLHRWSWFVPFLGTPVGPNVFISLFSLGSIYRTLVVRFLVLAARRSEQFDWIVLLAGSILAFSNLFFFVSLAIANFNYFLFPQKAKNYDFETISRVRGYKYWKNQPAI
jgi:hypothetical protein